MKTQTQQDSLDFTGLNDWFPVFRAGEHEDSKGRKRSFSEADLDSIVSNHQADDPAPFVVGHPKTNDPAYGWTGELKREGDLLFAKGKDVVSEFETAVRKKLYRNRSISIVPTEDGGWRLRHIGFLGAKAPAVAGLGEISFSDADDAVEFAVDTDKLARRSGWALESVSRLMRKVREWVIEKHDVATADQLLPSWDIDSLADSARTLSQMPDEPSSFSQHDPEPTGDPAVDKQFTQADIDAAVASALADEQSKTAKREAALRFAARKKEAQSTINALVGGGKLLPAQVEGLAEFMSGLPEAEDAAFEFAAADDKTEKKTPAAFFAEFLASLGKQISLGRQAGDPPESSGSTSGDYHGHQVSAERAELDAKARNYMKQNNCDYVTAVIAVEDAQ